MKIGLRKATLKDVDFLVGTHVAVNEPKFAGKEAEAEQFRADVTRYAKGEVRGEVKHSITYVIELDGRPVGRLRLVRRDYELMVAGIQILPRYQNQGIGSDLIGAAIREADERGVPCRLVVDKANPNAKRLYERLGFRVVKDLDDQEMMEVRGA